ncbi:MAG: gamma-glutamylcyclotransferase [Cyanobacteria bacterium P01_H01_bin.119]
MSDRLTLIRLAVNGTLMRGLGLNQNMTEAGAVFIEDAQTAPIYRLWSINDQYPAMIRVSAGGAAIAVEVWAVPPAGLADILLKEPPGLCIGKVKLQSGDMVLGVVGEPLTVEGQQDITHFGGWRAYTASMRG